MKLYHGATMSNASQIMFEGFQDLTNNFGLFNAATGEPVNTTGVFFSNVVLDENEGVSSEAYLVLEIPDTQLTNYEWLEEGKGYREWCIPAELANLYFVNRTVYNWEELQSDSGSDRPEPIDQSEKSHWLSDSFYRSGSDTEHTTEQEPLTLGELVGRIYQESLKNDPVEFIGLLHADEVVEFNYQSEQLLNWLIAARKLIQINSD